MTKNLNNSNNFRNSSFWQQLLVKQQSINNTSIAQLFLTDEHRFKNFSIDLDNLNLLVDFSKQHIDAEVINILCNAAKKFNLQASIEDLFNGAKINITENKPAWHTSLRDLHPTTEVAAVLQKMEKFSQQIYNSDYKNILCLGIGGSCLGPTMVCEALDPYTHQAAKNLKFYFIANFNQQAIKNILNQLDPTKTIVIISSKSFTTVETLFNANIIINWFKQQLSLEKYNKQIFVVTGNINKALDFGIDVDNIFPLMDWVGGRYSVWSAVGLPIVIKLGMDNFKKFLHGAFVIDQHFRSADFTKNIPVIMALISIWNISFMQYKSLAVITYLDLLKKFPDYLQQLSMESNGKTVNLQNNKINYDVSEIIWGGVGCNVQHSFMQMLHQGHQIVPVDFLVAANDKYLVANCLAQAQALMLGTNMASGETICQPKDLEIFKHCAGNRPSTTILFEKLTPAILGSLIALYEHKTFVQGIMLNINSFDQWGVELGKNLANIMLSKLDMQNNQAKICNLKSGGLSIDNNNLVIGSTIGLINKYHKFNI